MVFSYFYGCSMIHFPSCYARAEHYELIITKKRRKREEKELQLIRFFNWNCFLVSGMCGRFPQKTRSSVMLLKLWRWSALKVDQSIEVHTTRLLMTWESRIDTQMLRDRPRRQIKMHNIWLIFTGLFELWAWRSLKSPSMFFSHAGKREVRNL